MKGRPFMMTAGAVFGVLLILTIISTIVSYLFPPDLSTFDPNDPSTTGLGAASILSCLTLVCSIGVYLAGGALYARFHNQEEPVETQDAAIGGAASVAVASLINGLIGTAVSFLILPETSTAIFEGLDPEAAGIVAGSAMVGALIGMCCWTVVGGLLGALGGVIGSSIINKG